jgi:hypothetical protein
MGGFYRRPVGESVLLHITEVAAYRRFYFRWVVTTGFCQRDFSHTNEQQRHALNKKLISEFHVEVESIQTS